MGVRYVFKYILFKENSSAYFFPVVNQSLDEVFCILKVELTLTSHCLINRVFLRGDKFGLF